MHTHNATPIAPARDHHSSHAVDRKTGAGQGLGATARRIVVDLTSLAVERVAQRVVQLLQDHCPQAQPELITAGELALHLGVARPWIYKHRHLLGGQRIGDGPKAPWRFDLHTAKTALQAARTAQGSEPIRSA
jgi:hypothetical protein